MWTLITISWSYTKIVNSRENLIDYVYAIHNLDEKKIIR